MKDTEFNFINEKYVKELGILLSFSMKWGMKGERSKLKDHKGPKENATKNKNNVHYKKKGK